MSQPWDALPGWLQQLGTLIGAGGGSVVVLKLIEKFFARADKHDDLAVGLRTSMVQRLETLERQVTEQDTRLERMRDRNNELIVLNTRLEAESITLRERYHGVLGLVQILVHRDATYREKLGLPLDDFNLPDWLYQRVPGPTAREATQKPPEPTP